MIKKLNEMSQNLKKASLLSADFIALLIALWAGYAIRLGELWPKNIEADLWLFVAAPLVSIPIFIRMGLYRAVLRYMGRSAVLAIIKAITIATLILLALVVMSKAQGIPCGRPLCTLRSEQGDGPG